MARSKIDTKEFMLQYGDRIGIGIAGFLAALFVLFAMLGSGGGVSAEQVRESGKKADEAIKRSEINPEKIAIKDDPQVKPLSQIDLLSKSLAVQIDLDQLHLPFRYFAPEALAGRFRSNPNVMQPLEIAAKPLVGAFRIYEIRLNNKVEEVMVLTPRAGVTAPKLPGAGNNNLKQGASGGLLGSSSGTAGAGGPAGGGIGSSTGVTGTGLRGSGVGSSGGNTTRPPAAKAPVGNLGADESIFILDWRKDVKPTDTIGVTIRPLRSAYIAATYPHGKQTEEIAKKLQIQKSEVERLYRRIEVQRRHVFPKGSLLPDGKIADAEYVEIVNPRDRNKNIYKTYDEVQKLTQNFDEQQTEEERDSLQGWGKVNIDNVAAVMLTAYAVARSNGEGFFEEKEPIIQNLVDYAGPRVAMRLPNLVRSEYPDIMSNLPILMDAIKKIKEDDKAKIPPPPKDSRISSSGAEDGFDRLNSDSDPKAGAGDKPKAGDTPDLNGPIPDYLPIRFLDVDLPVNEVGGATYEYRLRVVLTNPNYKREKDVAAPEFAKEEFLFGAWSPVAQVTFEPDYLLYAGERDRAKNTTEDREKDKVPVELHKWLGKIEAEGGSDRDYAIVGDWWIERLLIGRGEYIGKAPNLPGPTGESNMIQWVSHAFDGGSQKIGGDVQKKIRSNDLTTPGILVDFQGGAFQSFRSDVAKSNKKDDVPAEILVLEPNGRMIARQMNDYQNDEARKQRFEHWKKWIEKLGKPGEKKKAAGAGTGGKGGPGNGNE
ncbi:MAG TPA: hypothetical protein PLN21_07295 [Gemmatales bacterium]|nr:hypothetical protein [Gemmatales bacterium]